MKPSEIIGLALISLALLAVGCAIHLLGIWSLYCNWTLPWFCSALALAVLIIALLCALTGKRASELDLRVLLVVYMAIVLVGGIGIVVDGLNAWSTDQLILNLTEWTGFAVLLLVLLLAPRCAVRSSGNAPESEKTGAIQERKSKTTQEQGTDKA